MRNLPSVLLLATTTLGGATGLLTAKHRAISTGVVIKDDCESTFCEGCAKGKQTRSTPKPLPRRLERIHSDVCGPVTVASLTGKRYVITFTNEIPGFGLFQGVSRADGGPNR